MINQGPVPVAHIVPIQKKYRVEEVFEGLQGKFIFSGDPNESLEEVWDTE